MSGKIAFVLIVLILMLLNAGVGYVGYWYTMNHMPHQQAQAHS